MWLNCIIELFINMRTYPLTEEEASKICLCNQSRFLEINWYNHYWFLKDHHKDLRLLNMGKCITGGNYTGKNKYLHVYPPVIIFSMF